MRGTMRQVGAGLVAAAVMAAAPAQAAPCWGTKEVTASRVRQMQTMLMVAALRCRAAKVDIVADYDAFVVAQGDAIVSANLVIKQHFATAGGTQADYDRFATSLANGFGDDETSAATCAEAAAIAHEAAAATAGGALDRVASARLFPAMLPGGACEAAAATVAAVAPAAAAPLLAKGAPPIVMAEAPAAAPQPVTLPAEVTAALTVLARFPAASAPTPAATKIAAVTH